MVASSCISQILVSSATVPIDDYVLECVLMRDLIGRTIKSLPRGNYIGLPDIFTARAADDQIKWRRIIERQCAHDRATRQRLSKSAAHTRHSCHLRRRQLIADDRRLTAQPLTPRHRVLRHWRTRGVL